MFRVVQSVQRTTGTQWVACFHSSKFEIELLYLSLFDVANLTSLLSGAQVGREENS